MNKREAARIKGLQAKLVKMQDHINRALVKAAGTRKISVEDLELSISKLASGMVRRPVRAARRMGT
jgi:hypothetical protein